MDTVANSAETVEKATAIHRGTANLIQWKPGQSGNPSGKKRAGASYIEWINAMAAVNGRGWSKYTCKQLERIADRHRDHMKASAARFVLTMRRDPYKYMHAKDGKRIRDERGELVVVGTDPEVGRAREYLLDRELGKPRQTVHVERSTTGDQLVAKVAQLRALAESPLLDSLIAMRGNIIDVQSVPIRSDGDTNSADTA